MKYQTLTIWAADWGDIILPDDFPTCALTTSGWFDQRYKISADARRYIAEQDKKLETGKEKSGFHGPSFSEWRKS